ncbi:MAG: hypothetical protein OXH04_09220 [Acidobacteria bacterium]|nr:hypothetical protein [Acidobacteriota bacterium]
MDILGLRQEVPQDPVGQVLTHEQYGQVAVVDLGKRVSETLREAWPAQGPFQAAGVIESNWLLPLLGAGSTAASSLVAGNVFMATANPATLMTLGTGVGSAVMGSSGIVAQAPFVAVSSALLPVVAPVVLFMTVASAIVDESFAPARSRMERWVSEFEASAAVAREESIVFYREWDSQRTLRAYHTRDLRLQRAPA